MDGAGHVLKAGPHLDRLCKRGAQFRHTRAHCLPTHNTVVIAPRHHSHKAIVGFKCHGASIGGKREAGVEAVEPRFCGVLRRLARHHHLGVGKTHCRDDGRCKTAPLAGNDFSHHFALRHGAVRQHRLARHITDGPHIAHGRPALIVDFQRTAIHVQHQTLQAKALRARRTADRHQYLIRRQFGLLALRIADTHRVTRRIETLHPAAQMELQPQAAQ